MKAVRWGMLHSRRGRRHARACMKGSIVDQQNLSIAGRALPNHISYLRVDDLYDLF